MPTKQQSIILLWGGTTNNQGHFSLSQLSCLLTCSSGRGHTQSLKLLVTTSYQLGQEHHHWPGIRHARSKWPSHLTFLPQILYPVQSKGCVVVWSSRAYKERSSEPLLGNWCKLNGVTLKRYTAVWTPPQYLRMLPFLEIGSYRGNQIKMSILGWVLIWFISLYKGETGIQREDDIETI